MSHTVTRQALLSACTELLQPARFKDYGPNGLQVEGAEHIRHIVSGVTASRALIEAAIEAKADAIFVHRRYTRPLCEFHAQAFAPPRVPVAAQ